MVQDLTRGKPVKLILLFTIPLLIGNVFQQFYSMADTIIVGRTIGVDALAGVGATGSLSFLIIGFAQGLTAGLSVITAQRFGADDYDGVRKSVTVSLLISAVLTVVLTAIAVLTARPLLTLLQTPANIIDDAYDYIIIIFWGIFASMLFNLLSNVVRALGDSRTPLLFLIVACVLNIALDFLFILTFKMGVAGAAWATVVAQVVSCVLCIVYIIKRIPLLRLCKKDWKVDASFVGLHCKIGLPMAFQTSIIAIGAMILQIPLNQLGSTAVGAFTAAQKIDNLAVQVLMSFGITMATYAAQNYGAGNMRRIKQGVNRCILINVIASVILGVFIILTCRPLVGVFVGKGQEEVVELARTYLIINCSLYFLLSLLFVYRYTLQGIGKSLTPTIAGIIELFMRSGTAVFLAAPLGFAGISAANPIAWIGALIPLTTAYYLNIRRLLRQFPDEPERAESGKAVAEKNTDFREL